VSRALSWFYDAITLRTGRLREVQYERRSFSIDVLTCPHCSGLRELIAFLTDGLVVREILVHLGLPTAGALIVLPERARAGGAMLAPNRPGTNMSAFSQATDRTARCARREKPSRASAGLRGGPGTEGSCAWKSYPQSSSMSSTRSAFIAAASNFIPLRCQPHESVKPLPYRGCSAAKSFLSFIT